jgi:hypothetical protein
MPSNREIIHGWCCSGRETPNAAESAAMLAVMGPRLTHTVPELSALPSSAPAPIDGHEAYVPARERLSTTLRAEG